jgi:hypothetical protein
MVSKSESVPVEQSQRREEWIDRSAVAVYAGDDSVFEADEA